MPTKSLSDEFQEIIKSDEYIQIKNFHFSKVKEYTNELQNLTDKYLEKLDLNLNILKQRHKISDFTITSEKEAIKSKLKNIYKLYKILENKQYNIAFIGNVGVGKTSAIAHSLDLTYKKKNRRSTKVHEILPVNTGNTTVCEVRLKFTDDKSSIELIPYSDGEFKIEILETIKELRGAKKSVTIEISRAIKNMVNYDEWIENEKNIFLNATPKDAEKIFFNKLKLSQRIQNKLCYQGNEKEKEWLEEEVRKINYGKNENCSLPKNITLNINLDLITKKINQDYMIIDTKGFGVENLVGRTDILSYTKEVNTICILCSSYNNAPEQKNIELLKLAKNNISKMGLLVIDRNNSQNAKDNQGNDTDDRDMLLEIKTKHIQANFQSENLHHAKIPVEFYDINEDDNTILLDFLDKTIKNYNNSTLSLIEKDILSLWEYCYHLPFEIEKRRENREKIKEIFVQELETAKKNFLFSIEKSRENTNPLNEYYSKLFSLHHMTIMALNNRRGFYNGFNNHQSIDYYLKIFIQQKINAIKELFWNSFKQNIAKNIQDKELNKVLETLEYRFDSNLEKIIEKICENISFDYLTAEFYNEVQNFWGQGEGYSDRVRRSYKREFDKIFQNLLSHITNQSNMAFTLLNYEK